MAHLAAADCRIDARTAQPAMAIHPEPAMALVAPAPHGSGGVWSWLPGRRIVTALFARNAERNLNRCALRLHELSPHLLADIGLRDTFPTLDSLPAPRTPGLGADVANAEIARIAGPVPTGRPARDPSRSGVARASIQGAHQRIVTAH